MAREHPEVVVEMPKDCVGAFVGFSATNRPASIVMLSFACRRALTELPQLEPASWPELSSARMSSSI